MGASALRLQGSEHSVSVYVEGGGGCELGAAHRLFELQLNAVLPVLTVWFVGLGCDFIAIKQRSAEQKPRV